MASQELALAPLTNDPQRLRNLARHLDGSWTVGGADPPALSSALPSWLCFYSTALGRHSYSLFAICRSTKSEAQETVAGLIAATAVQEVAAATAAFACAAQHVVAQGHDSVSFTAVPQRFVEAPLKAVFAAAAYACSYNSPCYRFELPPSGLPTNVRAAHLARAQNLLQGEGLLLDSLKQEDAGAVNALWPYASGETSLRYIQALISSMPTSCVRRATTGEPLAWMVRQVAASLGEGCDTSVVDALLAFIMTN